MIHRTRKKRGHIAALLLSGLLSLGVGTAVAQSPDPEPKPGSWHQILQTAEPMPMPEPPVEVPLRIPPEKVWADERDMTSGEVARLHVDRLQHVVLPFGAVTGADGTAPVEDLEFHDGWEGEAGGTPYAITPTPPRPVRAVLDFPRRATYKLLMRYESGSQTKYLVCSASPFGPFHLVTAAHCVYNHDTSKGVPKGWAARTWAFAAQTDLVAPNGEPDHPFGEARVTYTRAWSCWTDDADFDCDMALLTLDRRLPERTGWMGREWGVQAGSLNFSGYPVETPHVPDFEILQYPGYDAGNVRQYLDARIRLDAYTWGGHSGGPVWRYRSSPEARYIHGVNSTSDRNGIAFAARYTADEEGYYTSGVTADQTSRPPLSRPDLKEETYHHTAGNKALWTPSVGRRGVISFRYNVMNAGFAASGPMTIRFYLSYDTNITTSDRLIDSVTLPDLAANTYRVREHQLRLPATVPAGRYYLGWIMQSGNPEYAGMDYCPGSARPGCNNYGVMGTQLIVRPESDYNWTITASSGIGGGISPSGTITIEDGLRQTFVLTPAPGNRVANVSGTCGGTMLAANRFQTLPVTSNCTVHASFAKDDDLLFANGFE